MSSLCRTFHVLSSEAHRSLYWVRSVKYQFRCALYYWLAVECLESFPEVCCIFWKHDKLLLTHFAVEKKKKGVVDKNCTSLFRCMQKNLTNLCFWYSIKALPFLFFLLALKNKLPDFAFLVSTFASICTYEAVTNNRRLNLFLKILVL